MSVLGWLYERCEEQEAHCEETEIATENTDMPDPLPSFRVGWKVKGFESIENTEDYYAKDSEHAKRIAAADFARIFQNLVIDDNSWTVEQIG